jgi:hypothetical protein
MPMNPATTVRAPKSPVPGFSIFAIGSNGVMRAELVNCPAMSQNKKPKESTKK